MRKLPALLAVVASTAVVVPAADWPMLAGGPQRTAWARSENLIDKSNVGQLQVLYKFQADTAASKPYALTSPIVNGNLITYLGFKEMLIFGANSGKVFSIDADINKPIWISDLKNNQPRPPGRISDACPGGLTSPVIFAGSSSASRRFSSRRRTAALPPQQRSPYFPPREQTFSPLLPATLSQLSPLYAVSSDGYLHTLNSYTGEDLLPATPLVPPYAKVTSLNIQDNTVYATTGDGCDGYRNALYSLDLLSNDKKVTSFSLVEGEFAGAGGTTLGSDGTVYVHVAYSAEGSKGRSRDSIVALAPKSLAVKDYFTLGKKVLSKDALRVPQSSPLVFPWHGRDLLLASGRDGRLYLLDSKSLGGPKHDEPLFVSQPIARAGKKFDGNGLRGSFTSWLDSSGGSRWFYAPVFGPLHPKLKIPGIMSKSAGGSVVALKLGEEEGKPTLQPSWTSPQIESPASPVSANGMVFVLATGEPARLARSNGKPLDSAERKETSGHARLVVLDALTGKQLYASNEDVTGAGSGSGGLAVANGRAYFTTDDNTVYCFGLLKGQTQLSEQH